VSFPMTPCHPRRFPWLTATELPRGLFPSSLMAPLFGNAWPQDSRVNAPGKDMRTPPYPGPSSCTGPGPPFLGVHPSAPLLPPLPGTSSRAMPSPPGSPSLPGRKKFPHFPFKHFLFLLLWVPVFPCQVFWRGVPSVKRAPLVPVDRPAIPWPSLPSGRLLESWSFFYRV